MSKKMLKRSLALGALMAFVITGSAYADENRTGDATTGWTLTGDYIAESGIFDVHIGNSDSTKPKEGTDWNIATHTLKVTDIHSNSHLNAAVHIYEFNFTGGTGSTLQISKEDGSALEGAGIVTHGSIDVDKLIVNVTDKAIYAGGYTTITANEIYLSSIGDATTVYTEPSGTSTTLTITPKKKLEIVSDGVAIRAQINTSVMIGSPTDTAEKADIVIKGDVDSLNEGSLDISLETEGSSLTGKVNAWHEDYNENPNRKITLANGATWNVTGDSDVTTLAGGNGNIVVDMTKDEEGKEKIASVKVGTNDSTDTQVSGTGKVSDYLAANGDKAVQEFANSVTTGEGENVTAIDKELTTEEGTVGGAYTLKINEDGSVEATQAVNTKSDAVSDAGMTLKGHWRAHMNDMNKRMGELRNANGEHGVWTRMVRGESEYQGAKMQYNQYQLGYDEKLSVDKRWTVGAAVTFSEGDSSYGSGSTDDKSTAFAIYGSKLNNDGTFVDLIARYAHLESDLDDRNYGTGDYSTNGMSVSAEFGKRIQQGNGLWIEPQVELTYGSVDSASVAFRDGYKANYDSMDSFIARAGFALGKDIKQGNVYARASYLYDFDGETETQFEGGKAISEDFGGGWWEVGVGANFNLSKATYIYADIEKTFGGEVDTNWQWNLGVRYSF